MSHPPRRCLPLRYLELFGLQRSGTDYLQWLLEHNFSGARVLVAETGWKHGPVPVAIDGSGRDWHGPDWPLEVAEPFVERRLAALGPAGIEDLERAFGTRRFLYVFVVEDPYAWCASFARYAGRDLGDSALGAIELWGRRNRHWLDVARRFADRSRMVRYEDLLADSEAALAPLVRLGVKRTSRPWQEMRRRMTPRGVPSIRAFDRDYYLQGRYLERYDRATLSTVGRGLRGDLVLQLGYGPQGARAPPRDRYSPEQIAIHEH